MSRTPPDVETRKGAAVLPAYDGRSAGELAAILELPRVLVFDEVGSTLDVAHELGEKGAPAGTLVVADAQRAGRGRMGRSWRSDPGAGIWLTLLERPAAGDELGVLALRLALAIAPKLDALSDHPVQVKWPNDLYIAGKKLAGVLVEARWRGARLDWLAIGVGINVTAPAALDAASLSRDADRIQVLAAIIPAVREAVAAPGPLTEQELSCFRSRDFAIGRRCVEPAVGIVAGVDSSGALLIEGDEGTIAAHAGSLVLESDVRSLGGPA